MKALSPHITLTSLLQCFTKPPFQHFNQKKSVILGTLTLFKYVVSNKKIALNIPTRLVGNYVISNNVR